MTGESIANNDFDPENWRRFANCLGSDVRVFYPTQGEGVDDAKDICRDCSVQEPCLVEALTTPREKFGVWGKTSERERRRLVRMLGLPDEPGSVD